MADEEQTPKGLHAYETLAQVIDELIATLTGLNEDARA
jgi:hypothetical protein